MDDFPGCYRVQTVVGYLAAKTQVWQFNGPVVASKRCWAWNADEQHGKINDIVDRVLENARQGVS